MAEMGVGKTKSQLQSVYKFTEQFVQARQTEVAWRHPSIQNATEGSDFTGVRSRTWKNSTRRQDFLLAPCQNIRAMKRVEHFHWCLVHRYLYATDYAAWCRGVALPPGGGGRGGGNVDVVGFDRDPPTTVLPDDNDVKAGSNTPERSARIATADSRASRTWRPTVPPRLAAAAFVHLDTTGEIAIDKSMSVSSTERSFCFCCCVAPSAPPSDTSSVSSSSLLCSF
jgi:hypothetical protein